MKRFINYSLTVLSISVLTTACVEMKTLTLYEEVPQEDLSAEAFNDFGAKTIYKDNPTDEVWGLDDKDCKQVILSTDNPKEGDNCLEIKWDKSSGCFWSGFGIGWGRWEGKDISEIQNFAAIEMWVRSKEGRHNYIPTVMLLEDYAGAMTASPFNTLSLQGEYITPDKWTKAVIPLSSFPLKSAGKYVDMSNIKQIVFELQGAGHFFFDEIKIVEYDNKRYQSARMNQTANNNLPQVLYGDHMKNSWGISTGHCDNFTFDETQGFESRKSILVDRKSPSKCDWNEFGLSWNSWERTDISGFYKKAALQFYVKSEGATDSLKTLVSIHDYNGHKGEIALDTKHLDSKSFNGEWQSVTIPLEEFGFVENEIDPKIMREIKFRVNKGIKFHLDQIQFIELNAN